MGLPANQQQNERLLKTLLSEIKSVIERHGITARITQAEALGSVNGHGINIKVVVDSPAPLASGDFDGTVGELKSALDNGYWQENNPDETDAFENYRR